MTVKRDFWRNKIVLVSGFEGFLGSNLTKSLLDKGAKVIGLDIKTSRKETIFRAGDYRKIVVYKGSVANRKFLKFIFNKHRIEVAFHLAAEAIVCRSHSDPLNAFESNIAGTWEVLEVTRLYSNVRAIVVASSDKAYGEHKKLPYREDASLIANHPYDVSKSCADLIANTYAHTYGLPVAITRCGNIYGPGDFNFSRLIPEAMRCLFYNRTLKIRSDGKFVRDYVYVDDVVSGYMKIAESLFLGKNSGEAFNLSDESPFTVMGVLKKISGLEVSGKKLRYEIMNTAKYEIKEQYLSSIKARRMLGWKPEHSIAEGLKKTAAWYMEYFNGKH
jgi:CDP-glucose 4,6-dehydratase